MKNHGIGQIVPSLAAALLLFLAPAASAAVTFFVNPDGNLNAIPPADPSRDLPFQAALTVPFTEFDFHEYGHTYITSPSPFMAGSVLVTPRLVDAAGNDAADLGANGDRLIETYAAVPLIAGIIGGGTDGATLLNRVYAGGGADVVGPGISFAFDAAVQGFGTWVMDDIIEPDQYVLQVTELGGATYTSPPLESGNGTNLAIDGFIGVVSDVGIIKVVVQQQTLDGSPSASDFFYLDHVQVGGRLPPEVCNDGVDNNGDGLVDCHDPECSSSPFCPETCDNGTDDNGDGLIDCADPQCHDNPAHPECGETMCGDGIDNDGDGSMDCGDPDCFGKSGCTAEGLCGDGKDNDGDGLIDCTDPDCSASASCPEVCNDGIDNNADGLVDCADPKCTSSPICHETCNDGIDNNGDGLIDCVDPQCAGLSACANVPAFFVNPDGNLVTPPADPSRDLSFQAALTLPFTEFDFHDYGHTYIIAPSPLLTPEGVVVTPNLLDVNGAHAADLNANGNRLVETWSALPLIAGIIGGGTDGAALLNRTYAGGGADVVGAGIEFVFSKPVEGFGIWIMDDTVQANRFVLRVFEVGGAVTVSPPLDSKNGTRLAIEGFIGTVSKVGITRVAIEQQTLLGAPSTVDFFYLDHAQVGSKYPGCSRPFADVDGDGDVDQIDFGTFQTCLGGNATVSPCDCLDRDGTGTVDMADFTAFEACASGPMIPANPGCAP